MAALTLRSVKGSPLTNAEVDGNFTSLNTELITRAGAGANSDITSLSGITGGISTADYLDLDTAASPTASVGRLQWSDSAGTVSFKLKGNNVALHLGQEQTQRCYNGTGGTLTKGQVVYVSGSQGGRLSVQLASSSSESTSIPTFGVVAEDITSGQYGFVATAGLVENINTAAYAAGSTIWLGVPAGSFTTTKAVSPNHLVLVGFVVVSDATVGSIFVHIVNGAQLDELHDVKLTSPVTDDFLIRTSDNLWENKGPTHVRTALSINNVENTALSTWAGSSNLTTLGTISTGTWAGSTIAIARGGTGSTTKTDAFNALSPNTTKGDIVIRHNNGNDVRLPVGTDGRVLTANSASIYGVIWAEPTGGSGGGDYATFTGTTTDAAETVLGSITVNNTVSLFVTVRIFAARNDPLYFSPDSGAWVLRAVVRRLNFSLVDVGLLYEEVIVKSNASLAVDLLTEGGLFKIKVTGVAAQTYNWKAVVSAVEL